MKDDDNDDDDGAHDGEVFPRRVLDADDDFDDEDEGGFGYIKTAAHNYGEWCVS